MNKLSRKLYLQRNHPLCILKNLIFAHFQQDNFACFQQFSPLVSVQQNFDKLLFPIDHPARKRSESFFLTGEKLLRPQLTVHQPALLESGLSRFLIAGDCYRRDEIDCQHFPVFHQVEGVRVFDNCVSEDVVVESLQSSLLNLFQSLLGSQLESRWVPSSFPFTSPSFELEVRFNDEWMECLGCGVIATGIIDAAGRGGQSGWAFGLGLERMAMKLFAIPDIRLFWSHDERFISQFQEGKINHFQPFSKYPPVFKDVSFWIEDEDSFSTNDVTEVVREVAEELVEQVKLIDRFENNGKMSHCYRITFRSNERTLTNEEVDAVQSNIRILLQQRLRVQLR